MKILHSADWHLGKNLENHSRLEEQKLFLEDFCKMADDNNVDLVIVAGDIYDTAVPPIPAEMLLYNSLKKLSNGGSRLIVVIAGNHDSPDKITAAAPLAMEHGIIMVGTPKTIVPVGEYGKHKVVASNEGMIEVEINGEKAVVLTVPYPSEKRLNEILYSDMSTDEEKLESYHERMKLLFTNLEKYYREDTINIATTHLFAAGATKTGEERMIELGGSQILGVDCFPATAQYIALGHIHKPQILDGSDGKIRYSGSPIHYNKREVNYDKSCVLVELEPQKDAIITTLPIPVYKPIEVWECDGVEAAIEKCKENAGKSSYVYLEIKTDSVIREAEIKEMKSHKESILSITPIMEAVSVAGTTADLEELTFEELFKNFYLSQKSLDVEDDILELVLDIVNESETETESEEDTKTVTASPTPLVSEVEEVEEENENEDEEWSEN